MEESRRLAIKTSKGMEFLRMEDILCCVAHGRYTKVFTTTGKEYVLSKVLKEVEECLPSEYFFRTHKSYLINLNHLTSYNRHKDYPITLVNNFKILLAKRRMHDFQERVYDLVHVL